MVQIYMYIYIYIYVCIIYIFEKYLKNISKDWLKQSKPWACNV